MRLFLDTNVLIDIFARRGRFFEDARLLQIMEAFGDCELWVSSESFTDIFYVMNKEFPRDSIQRSFDESLEFLKVCNVGAAEIRQAARAGWSDFDDALVYVCAESIRADYLLTRDVKGFKNLKIPALSPIEFFGWLETECKITYAGLEDQGK